MTKKMTKKKNGATKQAQANGHDFRPAVACKLVTEYTRAELTARVAACNRIIAATKGKKGIDVAVVAEAAARFRAKLEKQLRG